MASGRLIGVVGPSGAGKDTLIAALSARGVHAVRRVVTRPEEAGGEPFEGVSTDEFVRRHDAGVFALSWEAHGLRYGIPAAEVAALESGEDRLANLSRSVLGEAARRFGDRFLVLHVTAPPAVLAERLSRRGREDTADIARRLERAGYALPEGLTVVTVDNAGTIGAAVATAMAALYPERAMRCI